MAEVKAIMGFVVLVALIGAADVAAQTDCQTEIGTLLPCVSYVGGNDKEPSAACCSALAKVVSTNASCLCLVLTGNSGFPINMTKALALPTACNVVTPPVSDCNKATAPAPTVVASGPISNPGNAPPPATGANTNAGTVFAPSMVAIASMTALVLMKALG
ncbi:hypothetical protein SUGI_0684960 [Cryptomeria japonica]|nr:hypothetical protein SUGI_0684960 [Cryptomeria japonica]